MYNVALVEVFDCAARLDHKPPDLRHSEVFPLFDGISERAIFAKLQDNEGARFEGEGAVKLDYRWMLKLRMDLERVYVSKKSGGRGRCVGCEGRDGNGAKCARECQPR